MTMLTIGYCVSISTLLVNETLIYINCYLLTTIVMIMIDSDDDCDSDVMKI